MEIQNLKIVSHESVKANFDLYIAKWGLYLRDLKLVKKKDGGEFVAFPSRKYERDGKTEYYRYYLFDKEKSEGFQKAVKDLVYKAIIEQEKHGKPERNIGQGQNIDEEFDNLPF